MPDLTPIPPPPLSGADGIEPVPGVHIPAHAVRLQYARSSGPGGQNVNKLNTKAELWVRVEAIIGLSVAAAVRLRAMAGKRLTREGEIHISSDTLRTQEANRAALFERLAALLAAAVFEPKPRRKTKPSRASKRRRLESKRRRGDIKSGRRAPGDD